MSEEFNDETQNDVSQENKNGNKKWVLIGSVIALCIVAALLAKTFMVSKKPVDQLVNGLDKLSKANSIDMSTVLKYSIDGDMTDPQSRMVKNIMQDMKLAVQSKLDKKEKKALIALQILLKDSAIADAKIYADENMIGINVPMVSEQWLYAPWDSIGNMMQKEGNIDINFKDYMPLFDLKNSEKFNVIKKRYEDYYRTKLEENVKKGQKVDVAVQVDGKEKNIPCEEILLSMNEDQLMEFVQELVTKLANDEDVKSLVKSKFDQLIKIMKETGDAEELNITDENIKEGQEKFEERYKEFWDEMSENFKEIDEKGVKVHVDTKYRIDSKDLIRQYVIKEAIKLSEKAGEGENVTITVEAKTTINKINEKVDIPEIDVEKGRDVTQMNEEDWRKFIMDAQYNVGMTLMQQPWFQGMISQSGR